MVYDHLFTSYGAFLILCLGFIRCGDVLPFDQRQRLQDRIILIQYNCKYCTY